LCIDLPKRWAIAGDYAELAGAIFLIVTAGVNEKTGGATDRSDAAGRLKLLRLRISNPTEQNVEHESATQQTKRNQRWSASWHKLQTERHSKKVSPESDVTETPLEKSGVIREEFITVV
jgi:hypothetical protein